ncbi:MAG TPA: cytochrome c [Reyranella sp.]|jgi:mono/diheme cytochrome c family protein|nr:cytochrome c [Reyranella sp.]
MKRFAFPGLAAAIVSGTLAFAIAAVAKPLVIELPADSVSFKPGPNLDVVVGNCAACHSADYIQTQPRGPKFKRAFWEAEVNKMINVYGAPIAKEDVPKIVEYLTATY